MVQTVLIKNQLKIIPPIAINSNFPSPQHIYIWSILEGYVAKMIQAIRLGVYHYFHVNLQFVIFLYRRIQATDKIQCSHSLSWSC